MTFLISPGNMLFPKDKTENGRRILFLTNNIPEPEDPNEEPVVYPENSVAYIDIDPFGKNREICGETKTKIASLRNFWKWIERTHATSGTYSVNWFDNRRLLKTGMVLKDIDGEYVRLKTPVPNSDETEWTYYLYLIGDWHFQKHPLHVTDLRGVHPSKDRTPNWFIRREELAAGMIFQDASGDIVKLIKPSSRDPYNPPRLWDCLKWKKIRTKRSWTSRKYMIDASQFTGQPFSIDPENLKPDMILSTEPYNHTICLIKPVSSRHNNTWSVLYFTDNRWDTEPKTIKTSEISPAKPEDTDLSPPEFN